MKKPTGTRLRRTYPQNSSWLAATTICGILECVVREPSHGSTVALALVSKHLRRVTDICIQSR
jgi:hypothetical protein